MSIPNIATTIAELSATLQELESGQELTRFVGGHGLQSLLFVFEWHDPALDIDIRLPYARVLSDEDIQAADVAEIGAALRMSILLLSAADAGTLLQEGEAALYVSNDENGPAYRVVDADGHELDAGDGWNGLAARMETAFPKNSENENVLWG